MEYSRIDARINMLTWQMEDAQREMNNMRENMRSMLNGSDFQIAEEGVHYARKFDEAFNIYRRNAEEIAALTKIREELK